MIKAFALSLLCFTLFLTIHHGIFARFASRRSITTAFMLFGIFAVVYVVAFVLTPSEASWAGALGLDDDGEFSRPYTVISLITGLALYLMAYVVYIAGLYVAADRSMSVRILIELVLAGGRTMSKDEIRGVYNLDGFYDRRFDDLIYGGYIV
jgi:hypothetical protein